MIGFLHSQCPTSVVLTDFLPSASIEQRREHSIDSTCRACASAGLTCRPGVESQSTDSRPRSTCASAAISVPLLAAPVKKKDKKKVWCRRRPPFEISKCLPSNSLDVEHKQHQHHKAQKRHYSPS